MTLEATHNSKGVRIDKFLSDHLHQNYPEKRYRELFSRNHVKAHVIPITRVNEAEVKPSYRIREDDLMIISDEELSAIVEKLYIELTRDENIEAEEGNLNIVSETEQYLVVDKPHGVVVHPGIGNNSGTLANFVRSYLEKNGEYDPLVKRAGIVHRLDKSVSGLMVIAKNRQFQLYLKSQFESHNILKIYEAKVRDIPRIIFRTESVEENDLAEITTDWKGGRCEMNDKWVLVEGSIARDPNYRKKMLYSSFVNLEGGKYAKMYLARSSTDTVLVRIITGRMHQIRATLKYLNSTVVGDTLYSGKDKFPDKIELRSRILGFEDGNQERIIYRIE